MGGTTLSGSRCGRARGRGGSRGTRRREGEQAGGRAGGTRRGRARRRTGERAGRRAARAKTRGRAGGRAAGARAHGSSGRAGEWAAATRRQSGQACNKVIQNDIMSQIFFTRTPMFLKFNISAMNLHFFIISDIKKSA